MNRFATHVLNLLRFHARPTGQTWPDGQVLIQPAVLLIEAGQEREA